jgi:hypothetical protein
MKHIIISVFLNLVFITPSLSAQETQEPSELELDPFNVSIYRNGRVEGQVTVILKLEAKDPSELSSITERLPQIRADIFTGLTELARQYFDVNKPIQPDLVRDYLLFFLNQRLGEGRVDLFVVQAGVNPT